ncbi:3-hydroxybutyrate dehydrogenase [Nakamurella lactea]|uniref:3-hydroxybutyrate dehydrogenase n=1 Tax=Nakamurella lactea TaxID=459515 RepID=UPI000A004510|nr:3-hydroxybutyrate dehydrogenase [Nakamurella lactea]
MTSAHIADGGPFGLGPNTRVLPQAGRTALVTGAASGIGAAIARRLAAEGASVFAVDRDAVHLQSLVDEIGATPMQVDLSDIGNLPAAIADVAGSVDILVNNAGIQHVRPIQDFPVETFEQIIALMLTAPFVLTKAVLPGMYERGWGRLVHISSAHGRRASEFKVAYVAAKHGLEGLSKVAALEGASHGVTSNCVNPGYVNTPLVQAQIADQAKAHGLPADEVLATVMLSSSPIKRLVEAPEVAAAVSYLCGEGSDSITGSDLVLDGGWGAR